MQRIAVTYGDISVHLETENDNPLVLDYISELARTTIVDLIDEMSIMDEHDDEVEGLSHREAANRDYLLENNEEFDQGAP